MLLKYFSTQRVHCVTIETSINDKQGVLLVGLVHFDLVIIRINVYEAQELIAHYGINKLVDLK